jgi:hypothetical protein
MSSNSSADPDQVQGDDKERIQVVCMMTKNFCKPGIDSFDWEIVIKAKIDHARVRHPSDKDQFPKITIAGDGNPSLAVGNPQDFDI